MKLRFFATLAVIVFCANLMVVSTAAAAMQERDVQGMAVNPVSYFEIPVTDMNRAVVFYEAVFGVSLERTMVDGHEMALFGYDADGAGVSGALAKGDSYVPSASGPRIYFSVADIDETLRKAVAMGGSIAYPKTSVGDFWVAEFRDSEGNQIALSSTGE